MKFISYIILAMFLYSCGVQQHPKSKTQKYLERKIIRKSTRLC